MSKQVKMSEALIVYTQLYTVVQVHDALSIHISVHIHPRWHCCTYGIMQCLPQLCLNGFSPTPWIAPAIYVLTKVRGIARSYLKSHV